MAERRIAVGWAEGLHARPAALFCRAATALGVPVTVRRGEGAAVSASSMLGVLALGAEQGDEIVLASEGDGPAERSALDRLAKLVTEGLEALPDEA
ncbi:HPr family phosphocarrier protein [Streptomyces sp. TR06-5]|uniref:HPr family phosphocarrier protein n=1 Tax=unclassified Streptomyces TaxID=2593676 RepID=UPI0039A16C44